MYKRWMKKVESMLLTIVVAGSIGMTSQAAYATESNQIEQQKIELDTTSNLDKKNTQIPENEKLNLQNPYKSTQGDVVWDCVYFGNYEQYLEGWPDLTKSEWEATPVLWRVLSVSEDGKDVWLMSDECLEGGVNQPNQVTSTCWADCMIRSLLNGYDATYNTSANDYTGRGLIDRMFTEQEKELIKTVRVKNDVGEDTKDKLYLLSTDEVTNGLYGFTDDIDRVAHCTNHCFQQSAAVINLVDGFYNIAWQLRSYSLPEGSVGNVNPADIRTDYVHIGGEIVYEGSTSTNGYLPMRPVLHLDMDKLNSEEYAGLVTYAGQVTSSMFNRDKEKNSTNEVVNPSRVDTRSAWDTVTFGNYYKTNSAKKEPIIWRVLSISEDGQEALLMSDQIIDMKRFNEQVQSTVTWNNCTLRSWMNGYGSSMNQDGIDYQNNSFLSEAFSKEESDCLLEKKCAETGTIDKIRLLTQAECRNENYGFLATKKSLVLDTSSSYSRYLSMTPYAENKGTIKYAFGMGAGWLMDKLGPDSNFASVMNQGQSDNNGSVAAAKDGVGICPVISINFSKACQLGLIAYNDTVYSKKDSGRSVLFDNIAYGEKLTAGIFGDVDKDGEVALSDAQQILKAALSIVKLTNDKIRYADMDGDGEITLQDAQLCLKTALGILPEKMIDNITDSDNSNQDKDDDTNEDDEALRGQETKWIYDTESTRHKTMYDGTVIHEEKVSLGGDNYVWGWFDEDAEKQMREQLDYMISQVSVWQLPVWDDSLQQDARYNAAYYAYYRMPFSSYHMNTGGLPNVLDNRRYITIGDGRQEPNAIACFVYDVWQDKKDDSYYGEYWKTFFGTYYASYN